MTHRPDQSKHPGRLTGYLVEELTDGREHPTRTKIFWEFALGPPTVFVAFIAILTFINHLDHRAWGPSFWYGMVGAFVVAVAYIVALVIKHKRKQTRR